MRARGTPGPSREPQRPARAEGGGACFGGIAQARGWRARAHRHRRARRQLRQGWALRALEGGGLARLPCFSRRRQLVSAPTPLQCALQLVHRHLGRGAVVARHHPRRSDLFPPITPQARASIPQRPPLSHLPRAFQGRTAEVRGDRRRGRVIKGAYAPRQARRPASEARRCPAAWRARPAHAAHLRSSGAARSGGGSERNARTLSGTARGKARRRPLPAGPPQPPPTAETHR